MRKKILKIKIKKGDRRTHVLVGNDLDIDNMTGSLEYLLQDVLCDPVVETSDIKCSFVWLRSGPTHKSTSTGGGHHAPRHRRSNRRRDRVGVLGDHNWRTRRRGHVRTLAIVLGRIILLLARSSG